MENLFSNQRLLHVFTNHWKSISLTTFIGAIVVAASTFLIKPKYKAYASVYPTNLGAYSKESFTEQMLAFVSSTDIAKAVIDELELDKHWGISKEDKTYNYKIFEYYYDFINIRKTPYESIEISALSTDPKLSYAIINAILKNYNNKIRNIHSKKINELITINKNIAATIESEIEITKKTIQQIIELSGDKSLAPALTIDNKYFQLKPKEPKIRITDYSNMTERLKNYGTEFIYNFSLYNQQVELLAGILVKNQELIIERDKEIDYYVLVSSPFVPDKKTSPKRGVITLLGALSFFLLAVIFFSIKESNLYPVEK